MPLPRVNATVTSVSSAGRSEDYDVASDAGPVKWSGSNGVYVMESWKTYFSQSEGALKRFKIVTMYVPLDMLPDGVALDPGDIVVYDYNGTTSTRKIQDVTPNILPGHPLQNYQVVMEPLSTESP